tara:strand:+ start:1095 stop:1355 length:261 start_codon:yes stop_codon:yes gene_type:complete
MAKNQKVKFHRGDKRPGDQQKKDLHYRKKMTKKNGDIIWQVLEYPNKVVVAEYFFEEDAHRLVKFQNKNKVWNLEGGIPKFLHITL